MEQKGYIAVNDRLSTAGAIIWWRLSKGLSLANLTQAWIEAGLNPAKLPGNITPNEAMKRACVDAQSGHAGRLLARPIGRGAGYAMVWEDVVGEAEETLEHHVLGKVKLEHEEDRGEVPVYISEMEHPTEFTQLPIHISMGFEQHMSQLAPQDIGRWVVDALLPGVKAISLRDHGGIYFIPNEFIEPWKKAADTIGSVSQHKFFFVPAMRSEDAVVAILDAVEREAIAVTMDIETELGENGLGKAALKNRQIKLIAIEEKLSYYEELLGKKSEMFPGLKEEVAAGITKAIFAIDGTNQLGIPGIGADGSDD